MNVPENKPQPAANQAAGPGRFDKWFANIALTTGCTILALMTLLCVFNVLVMRKLLNAPITGAEDVLILCLVGFVALSIPFGARTGAHIEIEVVSELLPRAVSRWMQAFARLTGGAFLVLMAWQLGMAGTQAARFGEVTQQLAISYESFYYLLSVCFAVFAAIQFFDAQKIIRKGRSAPMSLGGGE